VHVTKWDPVNTDVYMNYSLLLATSARAVTIRTTRRSPTTTFRRMPRRLARTYLYTLPVRQRLEVHQCDGPRTLTVTTDVQAHTGEVMTTILNPDMSICAESGTRPSPDAACTAGATGNYRVALHLEDQKNYTQVLTITPDGKRTILVRQ